MKTDYILQTAEELRLAYGGAGPDEVCRREGIILLYSPMGNSARCCKGFILMEPASGNVAITVNSELSGFLQRAVLYHELSHYFLHVKTGMQQSFLDFLGAGAAAGMEYEADLLAAELLIDDEAFLELAAEGTDFFSAAAGLNVPAEYLGLKLELLKKKGLKVPESPVLSEGGVLSRCS